MAMTDNCLQYTQSVVVGLIVSFLLAKLFSIVFSSGDGKRSLSATSPNQHLPNAIPSDTRRKSAERDKPSAAEFSRKHISGGVKELLIDHQTNIESTGSVSDDDWEGVETTELEEAFCGATAFVTAIAVDQKVSNKLRLELYGLYKIATEGTCNVPQPSAIKITARAKWNAWHKLGAMSPEEAMQKYLEIITELFPSWADVSTSKGVDGNKNETSIKDTKPMGTDVSSSMHDEESGNEFKLNATHDFAKEGDAENLLKCNEVSEDQMPWHRAVDSDHIDVAEMPLKRNAHINLEDKEGQTPMHNAADCEWDKTGALPVKKNASTGIEDDDDDGSYPFDLSHSNWHSIQP